jgi:hypothetical protein
MSTPSYDLEYLKAGLTILEDYLLSSDIYWTIGASPPAGEQPFPQLTLGGMLLTRERLACSKLEQTIAREFEQVDRELEAMLTHWKVALGHKAGHEFRARLKLWRDYLEDLREQPENHIDRFAYEVQRRVMLDLLRRIASDIPKAEIDLLEALDKLLKLLLEPGEFTWSKRCQAAFPQQNYWYLYGKPRIK